MTFKRVGDVGGSQLALFSTKDFVRRKKHAFFQLDRIKRAAVFNGRHLCGNLRRKFCRLSKVVVGQHRVENAVDHNRGIQIGHRLWIEPRLCDRKRQPYDFFAIGARHR